jgi:hypothetical protein
MDPIGLAGGLNVYGFAGRDPINFSDPFGLCFPWPQCAFAVARAGAAGGTLVGAGVGALGLGAGAIPGAAVGNRVGWVAGFAGATAGAGWIALSSRHSKGVEQANTSLGIAADHIARIGGMPPDDEDPDFISDMLKDAQKHLNNAEKYIRRVRGKTREDLQRQLDGLQKWVDNVRGGL